MTALDVYMDGSCKSLCWQPKIKNSPIGFACAYVVEEDVLFSLSGSRPSGNSYSAELEAALLAVKNVPKELLTVPKNIVFHTDCRSIVTLINEGDKLPYDLEEGISSLRKAGMDVSARWVRGHAGNKLNTLVHKMSYMACAIEIARFESNIPKPTKKEIAALTVISDIWRKNPYKAKKRSMLNVIRQVEPSNSLAGRFFESFLAQPQEWTITDVVGSVRRVLRHKGITEHEKQPIVQEQNAPQSQPRDEASIEDSPLPVL